MAPKTYPQGTLISSYTGHGSQPDVEVIVWSSDGRYIASQSYDIRGQDKPTNLEEYNKLLCVHIWEADTGKLVSTYDEPYLDKVKTLAWSPDGRRIALGYHSLWSAAVLVCDTRVVKNPFSLLKKQTLVQFLGGSTQSISYKVSSLAWSPDGKYIASGGEDHILHVWEATSGKILSAYKSNNGMAVYRVVWLPDGNIKIVTGGQDDAYIVDVTSGHEILCQASVSNMFYATECFALSRDGRYFASAENSSTYTDEIKQGVYPWLVRVWDAASGKVLFSGEKHTNFVRTVSLSPDSKYLASGSVDKTIRIWRLETGENVFTYRGHTNEINTLSWSPDSKRIASSSLWENRIHIWQAT